MARGDEHPILTRRSFALKVPTSDCPPSLQRALEDLSGGFQREVAAWIEGRAKVLSARSPARAASLLRHQTDHFPWLLGPWLERISLVSRLGERAEAREVQARALRFHGHDLDAREAIRVAIDQANRVQERVREYRDANGQLLPLIGRTEEIARLIEVSALGSIAVVRGAEGSGRTRLMREVAIRHDAIGGESAVAQASLATAGLAGAYVASLVRRLRGRPGAGGTNPLADKVLDRMLAESGSAPLTDADLGVVGSAFTDLVRAVAEENPLLMLLDDFDQADAFSQRLLEDTLLVQRTGAAAIMARGLARGPESVWDAPGRFSVDIRLEPLDGPVLRATLPPIECEPHLAGRFVEHALRTTSGYPGLLERFLTALHDAGALEVQRGRWVIADDWTAGDRAVRAAWRDRASRAPQVRLAGPGPRSRTDRLPRVSPSSTQDEVGRLEDLGLVVPRSGQHVVTNAFAAEAMRRSRGRRLRPAMTAATVALLAVSGSALIEAGVPGLPEGEFLILAPGSADAIGIGESADESSVAFASVPESFRPSAVRRTIDGSALLFGSINRGPDFPPAGAVADAAGTFLYRGPDDRQTILTDVSPFGDYALVVEEAARAEGEWRERLLLASLSSEAATRELLAPRQRIGWASTSPDGLNVVASVPTYPDSLLFVSTAGSQTWSWSDSVLVELKTRPQWCPDSAWLVVVAQTAGREALLRINPREGTWSEVPVTLELMRTPQCLSPRAQLLSVTGVLFPEPASQLFLIDSRAGVPEVSRIASVSARQTGVWLPDIAPAALARVAVEPDSLWMHWSERQEIVARAHYSDSSVVRTWPTWTTTAPGVAVVRDGTITAMGPGRATIAAQLGALTDTVHVLVAGAPPNSTLAEETFSEGWEARWITSGAKPSPISITDSVSQSTWLRLRGDGVFRDEIVMKRPIDLVVGATIAVDFRIELNRVEHQRVGLCLKSALAGPESVADHSNAQTCFSYPHGSQAKIREDKGNFSVLPPNIVNVFDLPNDGAWHHVSLHIDPTGIVSVFVDDELKGESRWPLPIGEAGEWYVSLYGSSVGGLTEVRNLLVSRGG